jgi:hypothetical protein
MGFNMSWIFVDAILPDQLYDIFDLAPTGEQAGEDDFGTNRDLFAEVRVLEPIKGNVLTRLSQPPAWWQTSRSIRYE